VQSVETREIQFRIENADERTVVGMAVPYEVEAHGERFARNAVELHRDAKLYWNHKDVIGVIERGEHTEDGYMIRARFAKGTQAADEAYELAKQGIVDKFSVGFIMDDARQDGATRVVTRAIVKEVSLTPMPWYETADVLGVRNAEETTESEIPTSAEKQGDIVDPEETTPDSSELAEVREAVEVMQRELVVLRSTESAPVVDRRSAGEFMQALAKGDDTAIRAYTGATTADSVVTPFDRDLVSIIENAAPLRQVFSTGVTPNEGMQIVFAQLKTIVDGTAVQAAQGDDLGYYEVQLETKSVDLKTIGNYVQLSIQSILRSTIDFLNTSLRGQAIALGNKLNAELIAQYQTTVAAQITANNKVTIAATSATYSNWLAGITDAAVKFAAIGLPIETLVVDTATFKELMALQGSDGRPVLLVDGSGVNNVGTISPTGLGGQFAGIRVVAVSQLNVNKSQCAFVNSAALRQYTSANLRLESDNAINMSSAYSLGVFTCVADEIPAAIVGIVRA
jgi:HK97 family phage prohead protease/HK97 family phage major capsid protein